MMGDSLPTRLALPELRYPIGSEPMGKNLAINQHSISAYIPIVESILTEDEMRRIRESFMGPILRLSQSGLKLSAKTVYAILVRSIVTVKENEAWFHFGAQPMRFSIREFHMVTGLKCRVEGEEPRMEPERYKWDLLEKRNHNLRDVVNQLNKTDRDASDERVCLAMLLLVESILLRKNSTGNFPLEYAKKVQDISYPWGRDAFTVLLKSIQNVVNNHLEGTSKFELQGYPLVFHLWILESIPLFRNSFSACVQPLQFDGPVYLCEYYTTLYHPPLESVLKFEGDENLQVKCILPSIANDPEDDVYMEDKYSDEVESLKDISKKGYNFKAEDWRNRFVETVDALDALVQMVANEETGQSSNPIEKDSVDTKLNKIIVVMEENVKSMKERMFLLEKENMELKARVSELEGNLNVDPQTQTPGNVTHENDTHPMSGRHVSPMTEQQDAEDFSHNVTRENEIQLSDDTPELHTQNFTPNLTQHEETETSTFEMESNPNQEEVKTNDEIVRETLSTQTQVLQKQTEEMNETPMNETPDFPITQQSIETPVITPIQTQQVVTEGTYEATEPLTEIISANNKEEDTHVVHNRPSSPISSIISQILEENKDALDEPETATQYFSAGEREALDETPSKQNQAEENIQDTTDPTTEIISTNVSKTQPLTQIPEEGPSEDGVGEMAKDIQEEGQSEDGVKEMAKEKKPDKKRKAAGSSQESAMDNIIPRRSDRAVKQSKYTKTPFRLMKR